MTNKDSTLTQEHVKKLFDYNETTGELIRKYSPSNSVKTGDVAGSKWESKHTNYYHINAKGKKYLAHRLIWLYMTGEFPKNDVDHIDGNGLNNKWNNLRSVTRQENMQNSTLRSDNTSGHVGVTRNKRDRKWMAYISHNQKMFNLGSYIDISEAIQVRKIAEKKYMFHELHGTVKQCKQ